MDLLHGENTRLKRKVEELQLQKRVQEAKEVLRNQEMEKERMELERLRMEIMKSSKSSAWSEVSPDNGIPGSPPSTPRQTSFWRSPDDEDRYTPQGTKVPRGPPPEEVRPDVPVPPSWIRGDWEGDRARCLRDEDCHQDRAEHHRREVEIGLALEVMVVVLVIGLSIINAKYAIKIGLAVEVMSIMLVIGLGRR